MAGDDLFIRLRTNMSEQRGVLDRVFPRLMPSDDLPVVERCVATDNDEASLHVDLLHPAECHGSAFLVEEYH